MSTLENIIKNMDKNSVKRYAGTKGGWNSLPPANLLEENYCKNLLSSVIAEVGAGVTIEHVISSDRKTITLVKKNNRIWAYRIEELLERLIVIFNDDLHNQMCLNTDSGKEAVDLISKDTIYELKPWDNDNNPLYACVELLKNYYLYENREKITRLVLLAPKRYYERWGNSFKNFVDILNKLNKELETENVKISTELIDIKKEEIDLIVAELGLYINDWEKPDKPNKQYQFKKKINLEDFKECFAPIKQKLLSKEFKNAYCIFAQKF